MNIQELSISERILLAEQLWDSVVNSGVEIELTEAQQLELDKRLQSFSEDGNPGSTWTEVKDRILSSK
ncbi:addiction module protein [Ketobacter sp. MCCC 1A13808]|uniref:addiction module protein n=1 Tax=Ketobacter sp. MCCC 1A13808 TaxID=2602738 RepID=UPI000F0DED6B|nr:addiction module protein [Ketobacter sp. MCCC 1A13808]MVF12282.1 addiction module protein [Ketobacter sp. MCCC 1A13808]RLP52325.1 MAG: addiction module protein [Ketobacter sp.]